MGRRVKAPVEVRRRPVGFYCVELTQGRGYVAHVLYDVHYSDGLHRVERGPDLFTDEMVRMGLYDLVRVGEMANTTLIRRLSERDDMLLAKRKKR